MLNAIRVNKRTKVLLLVVVCLIAIGFYHDSRTVSRSNDFDTYYFAGGLVTKGADLYTAPEYRLTMSPYLYLPFFAVLIAPLTFLNIRIASGLWYLLSVLSFGGALYFMAGLVVPKEKIKALFFSKFSPLILASVVTILIMWLDNVSLAQVDFMIFFLIVLALYTFSKKRKTLAGIILAAAGILKIYPFYFLMYFLVKRQFKVIAGALIGILLFLFLVPLVGMGADNYKGSMKNWVAIRVTPYLKNEELVVKKDFSKYHSQFKPRNQALVAVVTRYFMKDDKEVLKWKEHDFEYQIPWPHPLTPAQIVLLRKILLLLIVFISFLVLDWRRAYKSQLYLNLEYSIVFLSMLLLFPMVKSHTMVPMVFPVVIFNYIKSKRKEKWVYGSRPLEYTFWGALIMYFLLADEYMQALGAGCWSMLLLWGLFIGMLIKERTLLKQQMTL